MQIGKLMECKDNRINISEIPFKKYLNRNIHLTIIKHHELENKKIGSVCIPYGRSVYSIEDITRMALNHYMELQENGELKNIIYSGEIPEIKCTCKRTDDEQWFGVSFEEDLVEDLEDKVEYIKSLKQPSLICRKCCKEWGKMPDIILDIYLGRNEFKGIMNENQIITPEEDGLIWVIFDDNHIDWNRTGNIYL